MEVEFDSISWWWFVGREETLARSCRADDVLSPCRCDIPVGVCIIGITCFFMIDDGIVGRLLAEFGRINKLAEEGRSILFEMSDASNDDFVPPIAFAATWSAALTAAIVRWDLSCDKVFISGLIDRFLELRFSLYALCIDLCLDGRLLAVSPVLEEP